MPQARALHTGLERRQRPRFEHLGIAQPALAIKSLRARWGSCSGTGTITLNIQLMQAPKPYIDYVVVHELCHLVEHSHSKSFYLLLDRVMPDWRELRRKLTARHQLMLRSIAEQHQLMPLLGRCQVAAR